MILLRQSSLTLLPTETYQSSFSAVPLLPAPAVRAALGEEFGYVLSGAVTLELGGKSYRVRKGDSFSFKPSQQHDLKNTGKTPATVIWVCTPPNF